MSSNSSMKIENYPMFTDKLLVQW